MLILSELKKEYANSIEYLINASLALNKIIQLEKRLQFLSYNSKDLIISAENIKSNKRELEIMQNAIEVFIERIENQLLSYITENTEEIETWVDVNENLSYIFELETND